MKNIVIIGDNNDPHITEVSKHLNEKGNNTILFDINDIDKPLINLYFRKIASGNICDPHSGNRILLSNIDSVWWRVKPSVNLISSQEKFALYAEFALREWRTILDSLEYFTPNTLWINSLKAANLAKNKPVQLSVAQEIGFSTPNTLISNEPLEISSLLRMQNKNFIYKMLTWYIEYSSNSNKAIFTSKIRLNDISDSLESLKLSPGIFQEEIKKNMNYE